MKEDKEYIVCSAIHFDNGKEYVHQPFNITSGLVVCGLRHHNCFSIMYLMSARSFLFWTWHDLSYKKRYTMGFLTSKNKFTDRRDAATIAYKAGQIKEHITKLYSEDIW